jgi:hypothetical protein
MRPRATDTSVAKTLESAMKKKFLVIGAVAATTIVAGGAALAHSVDHGRGGHGPGGRGGPQMQGQMGPGMQGSMGHGMRGQRGPGQHGQMGPGMQGQRGPGFQGGPRFAAFDPARIDSLKTELGITAGQEPAWTKYTKTVQDAATAMKTARAEFTTKADKATPQDHFAARTKIREQAQKQFETVKTAADELLATLDDAQKAKAQNTLPGLAFGPGARHAAGHGGHRPRH